MLIRCYSPCRSAQHAYCRIAPRAIGRRWYPMSCPAKRDSTASARPDSLTSPHTCKDGDGENKTRPPGRTCHLAAPATRRAAEEALTANGCPPPPSPPPASATPPASRTQPPPPLAVPLLTRPPAHDLDDPSIPAVADRNLDKPLHPCDVEGCSNPAEPDEPHRPGTCPSPFAGIDPAAHRPGGIRMIEGDRP